MLSQNMTDKIIDYIMSHGGDFAEVFAEHTRRNQLAMTGGNMSEALAGVESGVGIRIFSGDQCAYFYTEDEREENLFRLLKENWKAGEPVRPDWKKLSADQILWKPVHLQHINMIITRYPENNSCTCQVCCTG